jgi:Holliday junction resolvase
LSSPSKDKGNRFERELVTLLTRAGMRAARAYGSNGKALGKSELVDVVAYLDKDVGFQCKSMKKLPKCLLTEILNDDDVDVVVMKGDRAGSYAVVHLEYLIELMRAAHDK